MMRMLPILFAGVLVLAGCRKSAPPAQAANLKGRVLERVDAPPYSYLRIQAGASDVWAAVPATTLDKGADVTVLNPMAVDGFESRILSRRFDRVYFGTLEGQPVQAGPGQAAPGQAAPGQAARMPAADSLPAMHGMARQGAGDMDVKVHKAEGPEARTVAEIWAQRAVLKERPVTLRGKVVRFNPSILGRNWIHLRDGSGSQEKGDHDITVTGKDVVAVGDVVLVRGIVRLDKDFGSGYSYPVILEDSRVLR